MCASKARKHECLAFSDVQERIAGLSGKATSTPADELVVFLNKLDPENQKKALMFIAGKLAQ